MAGNLTSAQMAAFQATSTAALDLTGIVIKRPALTPNQWGGPSESDTTVATVAGGWAKPSAAVMTQYAGLIGSLASWVVRLPSGTDCQRNDLLVMPSGDTLRVQVDLSESSYSASKRVLASEVR